MMRYALSAIAGLMICFPLYAQRGPVLSPEEIQALKEKIRQLEGKLSAAEPKKEVKEEKKFEIKRDDKKEEKGDKKTEEKKVEKKGDNDDKKGEKKENLQFELKLDGKNGFILETPDGPRGGPSTNAGPRGNNPFNPQGGGGQPMPGGPGRPMGGGGQGGGFGVPMTFTTGMTGGGQGGSVRFTTDFTPPGFERLSPDEQKMFRNLMAKMSKPPEAQNVEARLERLEASLEEIKRMLRNR